MPEKNIKMKHKKNTWGVPTRVVPIIKKNYGLIYGFDKKGFDVNKFLIDVLCKKNLRVCFILSHIMSKFI